MLEAMLAMTDLSNPLLWAVIIGWIFTVVLHEFAHGLVAYLGGDYTVRERGGLSLNPIQYIDPVNSLVLPTVFLLLGGVPLPGAATFVRRDLLRSRAWASAVSLAGPATNFLLFLSLLLPFHPRVGWIHVSDNPNSWTNPQMFMATLGVLQMVAVLINLIPVPPLDGFGAISPYLDRETREKLMTPPTSTMLFLGLFLVIWQVPGFFRVIFRITGITLQRLGFDDDTIIFFGKAFARCLRGSF
jgi:Zn-dependent protease